MISSQEEEGEEALEGKREDNPVNLTPPTENPNKEKEKECVAEDKMDLEEEEVSEPNSQAASKATMIPPTNGD